jgi:hypothetical protein
MLDALAMNVLPSKRRPASLDCCTRTRSRVEIDEIAGARDYLRGSGRASDRKLRLFAVACCRRLAHFPLIETVQAAIEVAERFADGHATAADLQQAAAQAQGYQGGYTVGVRARAAVRACSLDARDAASATGQVVFAVYAAAGRSESVRRAESAEHGDLLRCLFGNPFREVPIAPSILAWNDGCIMRLAQAAYEDRHLLEGTLDRTRLAVLADAIEESGYSDTELLGHLRSPGPHVRGCHAVDSILGRT